MDNFKSNGLSVSSTDKSVVFAIDSMSVALSHESTKSLIVALCRELDARDSFFIADLQAIIHTVTGLDPSDLSDLFGPMTFRREVPSND